MKEKKLYTIGEVCRICNAAPSTLRYYDEIGIIKPCNVDAETGYRYYSEEALLELPILFYLKQLGFSLKEIRSALNREDLDYLEDIFTAKVGYFDDEIRIAGLKRNSVFSWIELIREAKQVMTLKEVTPGLRSFPERKFYSFASSNFPGRRFENLLINTTICSDIPATDIFTLGALYLYYADGDRSNWQNLCLYIENQDDAGLTRDSITMEGFTAVTCYHRGSFDTIDETVAKMKLWAAEHRFVLRGNLMERSVIDCWSIKNKDWWLMEIYLPIVEK